MFYPLGVNFDFLRCTKNYLYGAEVNVWQNDTSDLRFGQFLKLYGEERKCYLSVLLSEIDPYTLKIGDLSGDLAVLLLYRYHYYSIILYHIMLYQHFQWLSLLHLYSHGDIVVYLLYTTSFVMTLEVVKISYIKATVIILLDR